MGPHTSLTHSHSDTVLKPAKLHSLVNPPKPLVAGLVVACDRCGLKPQWPLHSLVSKIKYQVYVCIFQCQHSRVQEQQQLTDVEAQTQSFIPRCQRAILTVKPWVFSSIWVVLFVSSWRKQADYHFQSSTG